MGRCGEMWGDVGRYREMRRSATSSRRAASSLAARSTSPHASPLALHASLRSKPRCASRCAPRLLPLPPPPLPRPEPFGRGLTSDPDQPEADQLEVLPLGRYCADIASDIATIWRYTDNPVTIDDMPGGGDDIDLFDDIEVA